jgi:hypothetical protein
MTALFFPWTWHFVALNVIYFLIKNKMTFLSLKNSEKNIDIGDVFY